MNTLDQLTETLLPALELAGIVEGDWLEKEKDSTHAYPILSPNNPIEWRLFAGRPKDQLRAWQLIHKFYAMLRQYLETGPTPNKLREIKTIEQNMFDYQTRLMEMR